MEIVSEWIGRVPYQQAWDLQRRIFNDVSAGHGPNRFILCEHPDVLTIGRNARDDRNLLYSRNELEAMGYEVYDVDRGGDVTYHGPGQLVGYPIIRLADYREDLGWYIRSLEDLIIHVIGRKGLHGGRKAKLTGVWVGEKKICAIGVRASRWTTMHGFALNVTTNLDRFNAIIPCGIEDYQVTSIRNEGGGDATVEEVAALAAQCWAVAMDPAERPGAH